MAQPAPISAVVRALAELKIESPKTRATVLIVMGWGHREAEISQPATMFPQPLTLERRPPPPIPEPPPAEDRRPLPSTLTALTTAAPNIPSWLEDAEQLPLPDPARAVPLYAKPIEPLFSPLLTRAILSRLASAPAAVGEVDLARLVEIVATGRPLTVLPRRTVRTLAKGLELLIDDSRGLEPFSNDVAVLIDDLGLAVGRDRLSVRLFHDCPSDGLINPETAAVIPYVPPPPGTSVLVVTDLGAARQRGRPIHFPFDRWLAFAAELRSRGNPLAVLMPGAPDRVPAAIHRTLAPIRWDRGTGARLTDRTTHAVAAENADGAERLARLTPIAGRIDPQLLRALRLELAPDVGVEAEADLWFGGLAQAAAVTGIVLRPDQQRRLQEELVKTDTDLMSRAWETLYRLRTDRPWREREEVRDCSWLVAQEELTFRALSGLEEAGPERDAAERRLTQILKLLIAASGTERERDAVAWAQSAQVRLPGPVMDLKPMRHLLLAAALRGANVLAPAEMADTVRDDETAYLLPRHQHAPLAVWLRLVEGGLEASLVPLPGAHRIEAPALAPVPLAVDWLDAGTLQRSHLRVNPPQRAFVAVAAEAVEIAVPGGNRFRLSLALRPVLINVPPPPAVFIDREDELKAALAACLREPAEAALDEPDRPLRVFISYAHEDAPSRRELATVSRAPRVEAWNDNALHLGDWWAKRRRWRRPTRSCFWSARTILQASGAATRWNSRCGVAPKGPSWSSRSSFGIANGRKHRLPSYRSFPEMAGQSWI